MAGTAFGQITDSYSNKMFPGKVCRAEEKQTLRNIVVMEAAVVAYGVIDYAAYNIFKSGNLEHYRFVQGVAFATINFLLAKYINTKAALGFSLQVWGGVPDAVYYGLDKFGNGFGGFSKGNELNPHKNLSHLNFMPTVIGSNKVRLSDLITNNLLTAGVSILIQF
jgi:hypothetical protein